MQKLAEGIEHFQKNLYPQYRESLQRLAHKQTPHAMLITCADSRIVPSLFLGAEPGELFICRNAGNIVPPYGGGTGGVTATVEYAVDVLKIRDVIICGHSDCGAMRAALNPAALAGKPAISRWLEHADRARRIALEHPGCSTPEAKLRCITEQNVIAQLDHLATHPSVAAALARGEVNLYGWYYEITTARVSCYDPNTGGFELFNGTFPKAEARLQVRHTRTAA